MRLSSAGFFMITGLAAGLAAVPAQGKVFILPHVLEKSGTINNTQYTFDTVLFYENATGPQGTSSTVQTYIYDTTGAPMTSATGQPVANPNTLQVVSRGPRQSTSVDGMITDNGGFESPNAVKLGFGVIVISGGDPDGVNIQGFVVNSHTSASDLSVFGSEPKQITAPAQTKQTLIIPHVLETSGRITNTQNTFDTQFFMTYAGGLAGAGPSSSVDVTCTLYNDDNSRMAGGGGILLPQVNLSLSPSNRYVETTLEDLINTAGGFGASSSRSGYAILELNGDIGNFAANSFVQHALSGPNDLAADSSFNLAVVPEPSSLSLLAGAALLLKRRRHNRG